jgi:hypothetical protein
MSAVKPAIMPIESLAQGDAEHQEWLAKGRELARAHCNHQFVIGDWLVKGVDRWTHKIYDEAVDLFTDYAKYTKETLYIFAYVARSVETLIRIKDLSWNHHRAVAHLGPGEQRELLEFAAQHKLPLRGFQAYINENYPAPKPATPPETMEDCEEPDDFDPNDHWDRMPGFDNDDQTPFQTIKIHFACREDREAFAELVGQEITDKTRSFWYPKAEIGSYAGKEYVDAEPEPVEVAV